MINFVALTWQIFQRWRKYRQETCYMSEQYDLWWYHDIWLVTRLLACYIKMDHTVVHQHISRSQPSSPKGCDPWHLRTSSRHQKALPCTHNIWGHVSDVPIYLFTEKINIQNKQAFFFYQKVYILLLTTK